MGRVPLLSSLQKSLAEGQGIPPPAYHLCKSQNKSKHKQSQSNIIHFLVGKIRNNSDQKVVFQPVCPKSADFRDAVQS